MRRDPELRKCPHPVGSIVMVGGACGKASVWDGQLPLAERYDILRCEISGDAERDAREIIGACREAKLYGPHLLGHSLGSVACGSFCASASLPLNAAFMPLSLALVCPVGIPKGSPAPKVLLVFEREYAPSDLPEAAKAGLRCPATVILADGHYPFRDSPAWFNSEYGRFISREAKGKD